MKTPDKMAMELQGLAVTICLEGENRFYSFYERMRRSEAELTILFCCM